MYCQIRDHTSIRPKCNHLNKFIIFKDNLFQRFSNFFSYGATWSTKFYFAALQYIIKQNNKIALTIQSSLVI